VTDWRRTAVLALAPGSLAGFAVIAWFAALLSGWFVPVLHLSQISAPIVLGTLPLVLGSVATGLQLRLEGMTRPNLLDHIRHMWPFYIFALLYAPIISECTPDKCDFYISGIAMPVTAIAFIVANFGTILWRRLRPSSARRVEA